MHMVPFIVALIIFPFCVDIATAQSSIDPYALADKRDLHNADLNQLWRTLGISARVRETTIEGSKDTDKTFNCSTDDRCEAKRFNTRWSLLDDGGFDTVVRISAAYLNNNLSRFLLFHRKEGGAFQLVDYLDWTEWLYDFPEVSAISSGGRRWLVVKAWPHCGTGCSLIHTDWFELKDGKFRKVLTVPVLGHYVNENPGREFETRFIRARTSAAGVTLEFVYHVETSPGLGSNVLDTELWGEEKVVRFIQTDRKSEFRFTARGSEGSKEFVENVFSMEELGPVRFRLFQDKLLAIAHDPRDKRRLWLKDLLDQNPDTPELLTVRRAYLSTR